MRRRAAAAVVGGFAACCGVLALVLNLSDGSRWNPAELLDGLTAVSFALAGAALAWARPRHALGWVLLLVGLCEGLADAATAVAQHPSVGPGAVQTGAAWLASWVWFPTLALLPTVVLALYPTGHVGSRPRRLLVAAAGAGTAMLTAGFALVHDAADDIVAGVENPVAVHPLGVALSIAGGVLLVPSVLLTLVDAARRLWRAESPEREQLGWLLTTVVLVVAISYTPWQTLRAAVYVLVPVAIAVGVVRHRLLDLKVVVRRTLLFVALTGVVVAVFGLTTAVLGTLAAGDELPVAVAAALVALVLMPVRDRLQRGVDRLVYGARRDPLRAVASLARDVAEQDDEALLPQALRAVADALRSPYVTLLDEHGRVLLDTGAPVGGEPILVPLRVGGQDIGALQVAPRTSRDRWSAADRQLLDLLGQQVAVVVRAAALNAELAGSRDRVVEATAAERQRLHQELHDGLGPALSGIALGLEAAEAALPTAPERAASLLSRLRTESQSAGREVRRLVEGLRPAALDRQGLGAALASFVDNLRDAAAGSLDVRLDLPADLPPLDADADAAVYRIVTEAVTNVVRHARATTCTVALESVGSELRITVEDDGHGLPVQPRPGVGMDSMRRRATGLGGTWSAGPGSQGGTRIEVLLPVPAGAAL